MFIYLLECLADQLMPPLKGIVTLETVIRNVIRQQGEHPLGVHVGAELNVVLLGRDHGQVFLLLTAVLAEFDASDILNNKVQFDH